MKYSVPVWIAVSAIVVVMLSCGVAATSYGATESGTNNAAPPAISGISATSGAAASITISADRSAATTSIRSTAILISAMVTQPGGDPVPDGQVVDFTVSSGIGTLSGATTTIDGVATVNLSSTISGMIVVSATAGNVSATISATFRAQPQWAKVKIATAGTLASDLPIGGILASVDYPDDGCSISSAGVVPSGVASAATTTLSSNVESAGQVILALLDVNGIQTGEFATLIFRVADGFLPNIDDFDVVTGASVIAVFSNNALPGISVVVQGLTLQ